jgi:hypothetical protein
LAHSASLAFRQLIGVGNRTSYDFLKPAASARDCADETSPSFDAVGPHMLAGRPVRQEDFAGSL